MKKTKKQKPALHDWDVNGAMMKRWVAAQAQKKAKKKIKTAADLPPIYVVVKPRTRTLKHWRGYHQYEKAQAIAGWTGGVVSTAQFLRRKYGRKEVRG